MRLFFNIVLMLVFCALMGVTIPTLVIGFVLGNIILRFMPQLPGETEDRLTWPGLRRSILFTRNLVIFFVDFLKDLTLSNLQIAADIWTPTDHYNPEILEVPIDDLTDFQIAILATRITLTPGTLSSDISADKKTLFVHAMYVTGEQHPHQLRAPIEILRRGL